ncbi:MAG TPA: NYN domain-containing protein [Gemmatimonadales bacterium]|nr:NYN domain-containing protein [Gemmatimonadales bacterium]
MFLDYENLALGAREHLGGMTFDLRPIADALAERGRVVVRRAYADWSYFDEDRRMLTRSHVELIDIPQRMGASRKNAADIKMAVDALELAFERDYISTFVFCTGDSDFTPLVHKLRELNKRVIGVGVEKTTSALLPPACDEFLYYDRLEGVEIPPARTRGSRPATPPETEPQPIEQEPEPQPAADGSAGNCQESRLLLTRRRLYDSASSVGRPGL